MHYICTGECHGTSDNPQNCNSETCSMKGMPMKECNCTDGQHQDTSEHHEN